MKAILKRAVFLVAVILLCFSCMAPMAYAADSTPSIAGSEAFEGLTGNGKYLGSQYRDNYALDTEELGFVDAIEKAGTYLANVVLDMDTKLSFLGIQLFHAAMQLNVAELAGDELNTMQQALKNSVFEPLFIVGFIGIALALIKKLLYRNLTGIIAELAKVVLIIVFVFLLGTNTADVLSKVCGVTRDLGLSMVMQINGQDAEGDPEAFAAETAGVLWNDLIHQPWLHLEFLNDSGYAREDVDAILGDAPYSDARQETINEYIEGHTGTFAKESSWLRLGTLLLYSVVMIVKLLVYVACSAVMLAFQLLAIFYALLGIVIMILAMFESFGGIHLITDWLKKMLETQVMILITTMLLGVLIWFGNITRFLDGTLGWLAGMLLQTVIIVVAFTFRKQIFHGVQKMSRNPQSIPRQMLAVSPAGAASAIYYERRMERDRKRTIQYQEGAREVQQSQLDYAKERKDLARDQRELVEKQKETADLRNEKLRQDLERREEARQRKEAREAAAAEKEANQRKAEDPPVSRPRTTAAAPAAKNSAEAKTQESEVQRPVTTPRAAVDRTSGENSAIRYPEHAEGTAAAEDLTRNSLDYGRERKEPATPETPAHTSGPERPVTTVPKASGVGREDDTAAAAPSAVQRPMAAAKPSEATQWPQNAPQRPSERPEVT